MIANFTLIGSLYNHREYDTTATAWSTYPWLFGEDNNVSPDIELDNYYSEKMIWGFQEDSALSIPMAEISSFTMTAVLIAIDNLGNFGINANFAPNPDPIGDDLAATIDATNVTFSNVVSESLLKIHNHFDTTATIDAVSVVFSNVESTN